MNLLERMQKISLEDLSDDNLVTDVVVNTDTEEDDGDVDPHSDHDLDNEYNEMVSFSNDLEDSESDLNLLTRQTDTISEALENPDYEGMDNVGLENFALLTKRINDKYGFGTSSSAFMGLEDIGSSYNSKSKREQTEIALEGAMDLIKSAADKFASLGVRIKDRLEKLATSNLTDYKDYITMIDKKIAEVKGLDDDFGGRELKCPAILTRAFPNIKTIDDKTVEEFVDRQYDALGKTKKAFDTMNKTIGAYDVAFEKTKSGKVETKEAALSMVTGGSYAFSLDFGSTKKPLTSGYYGVLELTNNLTEGHKLIRKEFRVGDKARNVILKTANKKELIKMLEDVKDLLKDASSMNAYIDKLSSETTSLKTKLPTKWDGFKKMFPWMFLNGIVSWIAFIYAMLRCPLSLLSFTAKYNLLNIYLVRNAIRYTDYSIK